jgi:hypothetical protein
MKQDPQKQFEKSFQAAVTASLRHCRAGQEVKSRLLKALEEEKNLAPAGASETELARFEAALSQAVSRSQEQAVDDQLAWRLETALSREAGRELLSERSVRANPKGAEPTRVRFVEALGKAVFRSQQQQLAPEACHRRIQAALAAEAKSSRSQVVTSLKPGQRSSRTLLKRFLTLGSLAAGFALVVMATLIGGADPALAETVRNDHNRCCSALTGRSIKRCASYDNSIYGPLPAPALPQEWVLVASRMCRGRDGGPMIHNVYVRRKEMVSLHFLPPQAGSEGRRSSPPRELAGGDFPVMAWETAGWTVTACSDDLDAESLARILADAPR